MPSGALLLLLLAIPPGETIAARIPDFGLGYEVDLREGAAEPIPLDSPAVSEDRPLYLRVKLRRADLGSSPGDADWSRLDRIVREHHRAGYRILLSLLAREREFLSAPGGGTGVNAEAVEIWAAWVREVSGRYRRQVDFFGILDEPDAPGSDPWRGRAAEFGFVLKKGAVALRSGHREARILIGAGDRLDRLTEFYAEGIEPYVDAWLLQPGQRGSPVELLREAGDLLLRLDPSVRIWTAGLSLGEAAAEEPSGAFVTAFLESAGSGADVTLFSLPRTEEGAPVHSDLLLRLHERFPPALARVEDAPETLRFQTRDGRRLRARWYRFFDAERFRVVLGFYPEPGEAAYADAEVILDTWDVADVTVQDPGAGGAGAPGLFLPDRASNTTSVHLAFGPGPRLLEYRRFQTPEFRREGEALEVGGRRDLPVEEIIARHQEVQAGQDARVDRYIADGELTFHYQLGNSPSLVDLTYRSQFLFDREAGAEWVHRELLWNGVTYRGRKIPKLPYVEPERVVSLPLDISLTRDYDYRLLGTDAVDGREAYLVAFKPRAAGSLYEGRVWIDRETFVKLRVASVQTGLEPPNVSNQEEDEFAPVAAEGGEAWLLDRLDGQQILSVSGRNLVILREIRFSTFRVNPADFEQVRNDAYASDAQILRDTPQGFRFLEKDGAGNRVLQEDVGDRTRFWLGGVFFNESVDYPVPLAGLNYFDFHLGDSEAQLEVFTAGAFNFVNLTDPSLFGGPFEGGVDFTGSAVQLTDRFFVGDAEAEAANADVITQVLSLNVGLPFADFFKLTGFFETAYSNYSFDAETVPGFVTPRDTFVNSAELRGEFHRSKWDAELFGRASRRAEWEAWGSPDPAHVGTLLAEFDRDEQDFLTYGVSVSRQFFLPLFQKIRVETIWQQGEDLDRFSKFRFGSFGRSRLRGFGGSGVRFDQGGIGRLQYGFNLAEIVRFDATLDHARVRDRTLAGLDEFRDFTGFGLGGNFVLPRGFVVNFDYGIAVRSDLQGLEGEQEVQIILLRLF